MPERPIHVLFLCADNPSRSLLAEAALNELGRGRFCAFSAASDPRKNQQPHPLALQVLRNAGIRTEGLRSKNPEDFRSTDSPVMDLVITMCDHTDGEVCPSWPVAPAMAHWRYPDPSTLPGGKQAKLWAFEQTLQALRQRLELLVKLTTGKVDHAQIQHAARSLANQV